MSTWFRKNLSDALMAAEPLGQIEALFRSEHSNAGSPNDMAVFVRYESEGRLHCDVTVYFSPAAGVVAATVGATPCARPSPEGLSLLVGAKESWQALFPRRND